MDVGLFIAGAVFGGLLGFLRAVDLENAKEPANRVEFTAVGAIAMGLILVVRGKLYGL